jgi:hypothetical protein
MLLIDDIALFTPYPGGSGAATDPYQIATSEDPVDISESVQDWSKSFVMTADIDMAGETFSDALIAPSSASGSGGMEQASIRIHLIERRFSPASSALETYCSGQTHLLLYAAVAGGCMPRPSESSHHAARCLRKLRR